MSFFGEPARLPSGPARLAARTGALLVPAFPSFTPDGWAATMGDPIPVPANGGRDGVATATQALADALAALIATRPARLAHAAAGVDRGPARVADEAAGLRIGIVCPYSLDVPGGVQSHVLDLARALIALGHSVSVLAPADDDGRPASRRCPRSSHPPGGR